MPEDRAAWLMMSDPERPIYDRVKAIFYYNRFKPDPHFPERLPPPFHSKGFAHAHESGHRIRFTSEEEEHTRTQTFCIELFRLVDGSPSHPARLDRKFCELLECEFHPTSNASPFSDELPGEIEGMVIQRTVQLLRRLPEFPLELPGPTHEIPTAYFYPQRDRDSLHNPVLVWKDLRITSYLSTNVICVAICIVIYPFIAKGKLSELLNDVAALLDVATHFFSAAKTSTARCKWFITMAFLWVSWQRTIMIYFSFVQAIHLTSGVDDGLISSAALLQSFSPTLGISLQEMSKRYATVGKSHYMCTWAFELLRKNPVCIGMDFRRFHQLYSNHFGHYPARCSSDGKVSCKGDHPHSCQRFVGMVVKDQSAHDPRCTGCERLFWDETSFRSCSGAKAVSLEYNVGIDLRYRAASERTLAISHVWSHGQGGRPETGMNRCLHERYESIARSMDCDSYWMDTPCIPTDHVLRREAIRNINQVFAQSKATLVCDRDLMEIEIEGDISVELRELILVTVMTCDWNTRAWTFLEAFRARQSIYLLCKNNRTISLKETVEIVHREGSLDIGALLLTVPHLLPRVRRVDGPGIATADKYPEILKIRQQRKPWFQGFLTVENSAMYLSHRPASRPGDDVVIWSLLLDEKVYENAIDFWRSREDRIIHTSFLVSTTPRLNIWRLGWAPASPNFFHGTSAVSQPRSMGIDQQSSEVGRITAEGLKADWLFCRLGGLSTAMSKLPLGRRAFNVSNVRSIRKKFLQNHQWGALLRPLVANGSIDLLPAMNQEDASRILVVVCGANEFPHGGDATWEWRGVHEWDLREPLPAFQYQKNILLV